VAVYASGRRPPGQRSCRAPRRNPAARRSQRVGPCPQATTPRRAAGHVSAVAGARSQTTWKRSALETGVVLWASPEGERGACRPTPHRTGPPAAAGEFEIVRRRWLRQRTGKWRGRTREAGIPVALAERIGGVHAGRGAVRVVAVTSLFVGGRRVVPASYSVARTSFNRCCRRVTAVRTAASFLRKRPSLSAFARFDPPHRPRCIRTRRRYCRRGPGHRTLAFAPVGASHPSQPGSLGEVLEAPSNPSSHRTACGGR